MNAKGLFLIEYNGLKNKRIKSSTFLENHKLMKALLEFQDKIR